MRKSHVKLFFYFSTALLALSVLGAGVSSGQVPQKEKASNATAQASTKSAATNAKVDLNTASEKDLESLPGVGSATAKKITAGRPYSSVDDLSKAGVSAGTIKKIAPLVMVSGGSAAAASTKASTPASHPSPAASSQPATASPAKNSLYLHVAGKSWSRDGLGELEQQGVPRGRGSVLREDQKRQVHDPRRGQEGRLS